MSLCAAIPMQPRYSGAALVALLVGSGCAGPTEDNGKPVASGTMQPGQAIVRTTTRGHAETVSADPPRDLRGFRENQATVRAVRGQAECRSSAAGRWEKLSVGRILSVGSSVRTGPGSEVDLFLRQNGPVVRLVPDSELRLKELFYRERPDETVIITVLEVPRGNILGNVKKLAPTSLYEIRTPKGTTRVRGSRLSVSHEGSVTVVAGSAEFITATGRFEIRAGQTLESSHAILRPATENELRRANELPEHTRVVGSAAGAGWKPCDTAGWETCATAVSLA